MRSRLNNIPLKLYLIIIALTGCKILLPMAAAESLQPCWLDSPVTSSGFGQIGVARNIAIGKFTPTQISRFRALAALCSSQGLSCTDEDLQLAEEQQRLLNRPVYFSAYNRAGYIHSYAGFTPATDNQCQPSSCEISQCDPAWLCAPNLANQPGLLGVSYLATSPTAQYQAAINNALVQADYLYGVEISANKNLQTSFSATGSYRFLSEDSRINSNRDQQFAFYVAHQCKNKSTLFTHVLIDKPIEEAAIRNVPPSTWLQNPKYQSVDGAVGTVERMMASGLVSDQIKLAIKRAAIQLAFEKYSDVAENLLQVTFGKGGIIHVSHITENTQVMLKVKVMQIHFEQQRGSALKVYAWVARTE